MQVPLRGLEVLPLWTPGLLGYYDTAVSNEVEVFLQENVFAFGPSPVFEDSEGGEERSAKVIKSARRLGVECLAYLRDNVVGRNINIGTHLVAGLQRVVAQCKAYYNFDGDTDDELAIEYAKLSHGELARPGRVSVHLDEEMESQQLTETASPTRCARALEPADCGRPRGRRLW